LLQNVHNVAAKVKRDFSALQARHLADTKGRRNTRRPLVYVGEAFCS
jgi:hypothetical protein